MTSSKTVSVSATEVCCCFSFSTKVFFFSFFYPLERERKRKIRSWLHALLYSTLARQKLEKSCLNFNEDEKRKKPFYEKGFFAPDLVTILIYDFHLRLWAAFLSSKALREKGFRDVTQLLKTTPCPWARPASCL